MLIPGVVCALTATQDISANRKNNGATRAVEGSLGIELSISFISIVDFEGATAMLHYRPPSVIDSTYTKGTTVHIDFEKARFGAYASGTGGKAPEISAKERSWLRPQPCGIEYCWNRTCVLRDDADRL